MDILAQMHSLGHEQVLLSHDPSCGYFGIIAIHDTTLGPALGGTRFWQYDSTDEAITEEERKILYAPDYVINGGGVINVYGEIHRWPAERSQKKAGEIYETLLRIFAIAREERIPTYRAADRLAEQRIAAVGGLDRMWMGGRR